MYQATFKRLKADLHPLPQVPFISPLLPSRRIIGGFFTFFGPSSSFVSFAAIDTHPARCAFWDMYVMHPGRLSCPFKERRGGGGPICVSPRGLPAEPKRADRPLDEPRLNMATWDGAVAGHERVQVRQLWIHWMGEYLNYADTIFR